MDLFVLLGMDLAVLRWAWHFVRGPENPQWLRRFESLLPLRRRWLRYLVAPLVVAAAFLPWLILATPVMKFGETTARLARWQWEPGLTTCCESPPPPGWSSGREVFLGVPYRRVTFRIGEVSYEVDWCTRE